MNKKVTSKEKLLIVAKEIIDQEGIDALSIRKLAKQNEISIGCVYNYFSSKEDLIFALADEFWKKIFEVELPQIQVEDHFLLFYKKLGHQLYPYVSQFQKLFFKQFEMMEQPEIYNGRQMESLYLTRIEKTMLIALQLDHKIKKDCFDQEFTQTAFIHFLFEKLLQQLTRQKMEDPIFMEMIKRILY